MLQQSILESLRKQKNEKKKKSWVSTRPCGNYYTENNAPDSALSYTQAVICFLWSLWKNCLLLFPAYAEHSEEGKAKLAHFTHMHEHVWQLQESSHYTTPILQHHEPVREVWNTPGHNSTLHPFSSGCLRSQSMFEIFTKLFFFYLD